MTKQTFEELLRGATAEFKGKKNHPLRRPCDGVWETWMTLPRRILLVNRETYRECRIPYESTLQMQIKFHKG